MTFPQLKQELRALIPDMTTVETYEGEVYRSIYLGSYMSLDPCGRYHHIIAPNGVTSRCEQYWDRLERAAEELGGWLEGGEGDPTDVYFCLPVEEEEEETNGATASDR